MTPEAEQWRVACHEAGHSLAALLLGKGWGCALFEKGGGIAGMGDLSEPLPAIPAERAAEAYRAVDLRDVFEDAVLTVAGRVAERLDAGAAFIGPLRIGGDRTLLEAAADRLLNGITDDTCQQAFIELVARSARRLLGPHLASVRAIARELKKRRSLSAADVAEIHTQVTTRKESEKCES